MANQYINIGVANLNIIIFSHTSKSKDDVVLEVSLDVNLYVKFGEQLP